MKYGTREKGLDVIVVGAGFSGAIVALKAAELGLRVKVLDGQEAYPEEFRAEKLEMDQYEALEELGLIDLVQPEAENFINAVHALRGGVEKIVRCHKHRGIDYSATVNSFRSVLLGLGLLEVAKVSQVHDDPESCQVLLADGRTLQAKLCVIATGMSKALKKSLGLSTHAANALRSTTFGFDIEPASEEPFPFQAFNVYPEEFAAGLQYLTFFPIADRMRCNMFTCWKPGSMESKRIMKETLPELRRLIPELEERIGSFRLATNVQAFTTHYYQQSWSHLHRVLLVGDAYQSVSPATGVGLSKCLCDVQAVMELLQKFPTNSINDLNCASFYLNPMKQRVDDNAHHRWRWANESATSQSFVTTIKRFKRSLEASWVRQLIT